jgi:hypothetical protein
MPDDINIVPSIHTSTGENVCEVSFHIVVVLAVGCYGGGPSLVMQKKEKKITFVSCWS